MRHRSTLLLSVLLVSACAPEPAPEDDPCADPTAVAPGTICTLVGIAGIAAASPEGILARKAELYLPIDTTVGPDGRVYVIDWNNHRVRRIEADGTIHTLAGAGMLGDGPEGPAMDAAFNHPTHILFDPTDDEAMYIAAWHNSRIERVDLGTGELVFVAGDGDRAFLGEGTDARVAKLDLPSSMAFEDDGTLLLSDTANQVVRAISPDGLISTYAGTAPPGLLPNGQTDRRYGWEGDGGPALAAKFNFGWGQKGYPGGRILRVDRRLYLADTYNFTLRYIDMDDLSIHHVAGVGLTPGFEGDGGPAETARLDFPTDVTVDEAGNLYVADTFNACVRKIDPDGMISTMAGVCREPGYEGDGGPASEARLFNPYGVEVGNGLLYIADTENHVVRTVKL